MKTTLSLEWRVDFVRGKSSLSRNLSRNYLSPRRSVVTQLVVDKASFGERRGKFK
jgi:hypothetical protein